MNSPETKYQKNINTPKKILFVEDKWCAGKFEWGISEWENNLFLSLKETDLANTEVFYMDEYFQTNGKKGDETLLQKIRNWKPDLIVFAAEKMPGSAMDVPDRSTYEVIKNELKIPMLGIWGDLEIPEQEAAASALFPYLSLNLATASDAVVKRIKSMVDTPEKYVYMWVPKRPSVFNDPGKERDIEVSYVGTPKGHRLNRIKYLKERGIPVTCGGGERQEHLSTEQYADQYQRSKITLSFSRAVSSHVINARPFEAMACGAMVLEQEGSETPKLFIPYVDYVPFTSNKDLLRKARYYLEHDDEREKIARSGWKKTTTLYSAERFWKFAINKALGLDDIKTPAFFLSWSDLLHMPKWRAAKLKFLDSLCSTKTGFELFLYVSRRMNRDWVDYQRNKISKKIHGPR